MHTPLGEVEEEGDDDDEQLQLQADGVEVQVMEDGDVEVGDAGNDGLMDPRPVHGQSLEHFYLSLWHKVLHQTSCLDAAPFLFELSKWYCGSLRFHPKSLSAGC